MLPLPGGRPIPPARLRSVRAETISRRVVEQYAAREYPAVMVGSSNGAAVHLAAALRIPWLPQTFLTPVRRRSLPDAMRDDMRWGSMAAQELLRQNPDLQLHHMADPVQDRLTLARMAYFRIKRLTLGPAYETFLRTALPHGGVILLIDCRLRWPCTRIGPRHVFQPGGLGGAQPQEYLAPSERMAEFVTRHGSHPQRWQAPDPDGTAPEAEWGLAPAFADDVERFAREHNCRVRRIVFEGPEDLSPLIADLYRWWYERRSWPAGRLLVECFGLLDPWWTLRTASVRFWMVFNTNSSAEVLGGYLDKRTFDEIFLILISNGIAELGAPTLETWRSLVARARRRGALLGIDERRYPSGFGSFVLYHIELRRQIRARYPAPPALTLEEFDRFIAAAGRNYAVHVT